MNEMPTKAETRRYLRQTLAAISPETRQSRSTAACSLVAGTPEFAAARIVMLYLSMPQELDTAWLALRCWQMDKTVVVPKVSWDQKRMLPIEITSLTSGLATSSYGAREPIADKPIPADMIDLVIVPGLGFSRQGHRIGRGMGFYDRFLGQDNFLGIACGLGFEEQVLEQLPLQPHDIPMTLLVTDKTIRRFAAPTVHP